MMEFGDSEEYERIPREGSDPAEQFQEPAVEIGENPPDDELPGTAADEAIGHVALTENIDATDNRETEEVPSEVQPDEQTGQEVESHVASLESSDAQPPDLPEVKLIMAPVDSKYVEEVRRESPPARLSDVDVARFDGQAPRTQEELDAVAEGFRGLVDILKSFNFPTEQTLTNKGPTPIINLESGDHVEMALVLSAFSLRFRAQDGMSPVHAYHFDGVGHVRRLDINMKMERAGIPGPGEVSTEERKEMIYARRTSVDPANLDLARSMEVNDRLVGEAELKYVSYVAAGAAPLSEPFSKVERMALTRVRSDYSPSPEASQVALQRLEEITEGEYLAHGGFRAMQDGRMQLQILTQRPEQGKPPTILVGALCRVRPEESETIRQAVQGWRPAANRDDPLPEGAWSRVAVEFTRQDHKLMTILTRSVITHTGELIASAPPQVGFGDIGDVINLARFMRRPHFLRGTR